MKIITDEKLIKRNRTIGQVTTFASMAVLALGLYLSFKQLYITWSFVALVAGFILSQIGIYYGSRWGRSPRPDESITAALKGLDNKYVLYNYSTPVNHLLMGPAGIWIFAPYNQPGTITYNTQKNRWMQKGGNFYMKMFAQEGLGRPDIEIQHLERELQAHLKKIIGSDKQLPKIETVLVFTNEKAHLEIEDAPAPSVTLKKLKDFIRKQAKGPLLEPSIINLLEEKLPRASVTPKTD